MPCYLNILHLQKLIASECQVQEQNSRRVRGSIRERGRSRSFEGEMEEQQFNNQ